MVLPIPGADRCITLTHTAVYLAVRSQLVWGELTSGAGFCLSGSVSVGAWLVVADDGRLACFVTTGSTEKGRLVWL